MRYIVDRFEGDIAVCEDENKQLIEIRQSDLPYKTKRGDVLVQISDVFIKDDAETLKRREGIRKKMMDLFEPS